MTSFIYYFRYHICQSGFAKKKKTQNKKTQDGWVVVFDLIYFSLSFFCCFFVCLYFFISVTMQKCKKTTRAFHRYNAHTIKRLRVCTQRIHT